MQLDKAIKTRKSVRRFSSTKKPDWRKIIRAIDFARFAPRAGNMFIIKFILILDKGKIKELAQACQQNFVSEADYVVAAVSDDPKFSSFYKERGEKYARQQAGAAIENFLLSLNEFGLSTCWVGHFDDNAVKRILAIPDTATVEALFPIGYETKVEAQEKLKPDLENILYFNKWKNKKMEPQTRVSVEAV